MEKIAEPNEVVIYTGLTEYAVDTTTIGLMHTHLERGKRYKVKEVVNYSGTDIRHYRFYESVWLYPAKSFTKDMREYYKEKYKLR